VIHLSWCVDKSVVLRVSVVIVAIDVVGVG